jgi:hypothetical protein
MQIKIVHTSAIEVPADSLAVPLHENSLRKTVLRILRSILDLLQKPED